MNAPKRFHIVVLFMFIALSPISSQTTKEKDELRQQRFSQIDYYHTGIGVDAAFNHNVIVGPKVYVGIGSFRNLINADLGIKLLWTNPFISSSKENITQRQLPIFLSVSCNVLRWKSGSAYFGAEMDYHLSLYANHQLPKKSGTISDNNLMHSHASASIRLGVYLGQWNIGAFYDYYLAPSYNQKYVYESPAYDYDALHDALFERTHLGISVAYILAL